MKHDYIKKQMQNHLPKGIYDALTGTQPMASPQPLRRRGDWEQVRPNLKKIGKPPNGAFLPPPPWEGGRGGGLVLPKGPPGRSRSPGAGNGQYTGQPPDAAATPDRVQNPVGGDDNNRIPLNTEYQILNDKQIPNFLTLLNFTNMKKQILFLAFFVLVALASVNESYGQATQRTQATPLSAACADDALHPLAGKPYNYSVGVTPAGGNFQWWATKGPEFIENGTVTKTGMLTVASGALLATSGNYGAAAAATPETVTITWSSSILAGTASGTVAGKTPTFVAVNYDNAAPNCANNLKVYQLDPRNGFTVDIFPLDGTGAAGLANGTESSCIDDVARAVWNGSVVAYDYGTNTVTFEVVAANFTGSFTPEFRIGALGNGQTAQLQWSYSPTFATIDYTHGTTITAAGGVFTSTTAATTNVTDTSLGVSIYARLIISNNTYEAIAATPVRVAVDAVNSANERDIVNSDCTLQTAFEDEAVHNLDPRPTLTPTTPTGGFVPANTTN